MNRHQRLMVAAMIALALSVGAVWYVVYSRVLNPPTPFVFISTSLSQHEVMAGEHLTMTAVADVFAEPECYSGAQRSLRFSDRSEARVPGERRSIRTGRHETVFYEIDIPPNAPSGPATLTVKEIFTCGVRIEVESPSIRFIIRGAIEPGVDRYYDGGRRDE